jgi:hypothetical protein
VGQADDAPSQVGVLGAQRGDLPEQGLGLGLQGGDPGALVRAVTQAVYVGTEHGAVPPVVV